MEIITNFSEAVLANPVTCWYFTLGSLFTLLALWFSARNDHKVGFYVWIYSAFWIN